jgi:hypothetical protein
MYNGFLSQPKVLVMGHEFLGVVEEVGSAIVSNCVRPLLLLLARAPGPLRDSNQKHYGPEGGLLDEKGGALFGYTDLYGGYMGHRPSMCACRLLTSVLAGLLHFKDTPYSTRTTNKESKTQKRIPSPPPRFSPGRPLRRRQLVALEFFDLRRSLLSRRAEFGAGGNRDRGTFALHITGSRSAPAADASITPQMRASKRLVSKWSAVPARKYERRSREVRPPPRRGERDRGARARL